jgi:hypothetical protein
MERIAKGEVVILPFSNLTGAELRPELGSFHDRLLTADEPLNS